MAISRVPGYSLLANLDRQGTDIGITSAGLYVTYWDVVNYRFGINNAAPQQALDVTGNIITSNGHVYTGANISFDIGQPTAWWRAVYAQNIQSTYLTGTLLTNVQPNITSLGTLSNLSISGSLAAPNYYGNLFGNVTGTILTNNQPYITTLGILTNLTVSGNVNTPSFNGNLYGNVTGVILTATQPYITTLGTLANLNVTGNILANNITSSTYTGTLLTNAQPNITRLGTIANLTTTGNTYMVGNVTVNGNLIVGNITTSGLSGNITGNLTGYVLQGNQPYITTLSNITVSNITILGGNLNVSGNASFDYLHAKTIYQNNNLVLDTSSNIQVIGDVTGYGTYNSINLRLNITGVTEGTFGSSYEVPQFFVNNEGRILSAANIAINRVANIYFSNTTISSNTDLTLQTTTSGNIYLNAGSTGIVQIVGADAFGLPSGDQTARPSNPNVGYTRFNTGTKTIEYYDGTNWIAPGQATISSQLINPDGIANIYVLSANTTSSGVLVSINGTLQQPGYAYNIVNNNQIQFTETPLTTDSVEVRLMAPSAVTVGSLRFSNYTSVILDTQNINIVGNIQTTGFYNNKANTLIPNVAVTTIDSYSTASYRTSKYVVQSIRANDVQSYETLVTHNGTTAVSTTYGVITIGNNLGNVSATIVGSNVEVQFTPTIPNVYLTVSRDFYPL